MPARRFGLAASIARNALSERASDVARGGAHVGPMRAFRDREAVVRSRAGVGGVCRLAQRRLVLLVPHIRQALEEEQREDVLLVVARVDQPAQQVGGAPEVRLELLLAQMLGALLMTASLPRVSTSRSRSSAARASAIACLNAATASGSGGMSSPTGGST